MIQDYFKNIHIVNLDSRKDRWKEIVTEMARVGIEKYERCPAFKPNLSKIPKEYYDKLAVAGSDHEIYKIGAVGNKMSQNEIIKIARDSGFDNVLILEDDTVFRDNANHLIDLVMNQIKEDDISWDMLYFCANPVFPSTFEMVNTNLARIKSAYTTSAYVVNSSVYNAIIDNVLTCGTENDVFYATQIHPHYKCYCIRPSLAWQRAGWSDVLQGERDYKVLREFDK